MVQDGKLTVSEALVLLEELEKAVDPLKKDEHAFGELSTEVKFEGTKFEEAKKEQTSGNYTFQSATDKIFEFVDTAIKKIKDFDLDFNFGKSVDISHIFQYADVNLKAIDIDLANGSVKVIPWNQQDIRVECEAKVYRTETVDAARNTFLQDVIFYIEDQRLRFVSQQKWMKINAVVYVPQAEYENVDIRMFNGPIYSENIRANKYKAKTANGKIEMSAITSKNVEVETANGKIEVLNGTIDDFEAETINGAIHLDGFFRKVDLQSFNGNINCILKNDDCEWIEASATTGSVKIYVPELMAINGELKTNLGNFIVDPIGIKIVEEKSEVVQKSLSFQPLLHTERATTLMADTKTGSITISRQK